jgi:catechol 2,3-dioxygenase-like lactoylglutathione lyase family enzyme
VSDIDAVVDWYSRVLGFQLIGNKIHIKRAEDPSAGIFQIYPPDLNEVKIAYLATGNGIGFEVFQFVDPAPVTPEKPFEYTRGGFFHICVTDSDPARLAQTMTEAGGRQIGQMVIRVDDECLYVADPWGHVVEILNTSFDRLATAIASDVGI